MKTKNQTVLALYPNSYGIGYAVFNNPKELVDYGLGNVQPVNNRKAIRLVKEYIEYYKPDILITREVKQGKFNKRITKLVTSICEEAKSQRLEIHMYSRDQIKNVFSQFKANSKFQISQKIMEWYPELKAHEFPYRKRWMTENYNVGIFDAVSLAITHWFLEG